MEFKFIRYQTGERIAFITMDRAEKRNALNAQMVNELRTAFDRAAAGADVKVIVLKASGKAFSAGADLEYLLQLQHNTREENLADSRRLMELFLRIRTCPKAVIAQVQGPAVAGGCGLVTACDLVFSVPEARFGYTENKIGFVPALVAGFLLHKTGEGRARELLLSGELISAEKAREYGLVNFITAGELLDEEVRTYAGKLAEETSAASIAYTKELLAALPGMSLRQGLELAAGINANARSGEDFRKGIQAFLAKEKPRW